MTWYDANYGYKKKITIDHTKVGGDETDFPVLISITDNNLRDEANGGHVKSANGYDIIFTNSAETVQLKHEIERYVNTSGLLVFWVKVSSLSSTVDTDIYIYYGKTGVVVDPSTTDTWDANFVLVQHMKDDPDTSHTVDSTSNANDGTKKGANQPQQETTGKIGYDQDFDAATPAEYIDCGNDTSMAFGASTDFTIETWAKRDSDAVATPDFLLERGRTDSWTTAGCRGYKIRYYQEKIAAFIVRGDDSKNLFVQTNGAYDYRDGNYHFTQATYDRDGNLTLYIDDASIGTVDISSVGDIDDTTNGEVIIGNNFHGASSDKPFLGDADEIRISDTLRSSNWLTTTWNTTDSPATFVSWGAEEEKPAGVGADIYYHDGTNNIELQRDDSSPIQMYNGTEIIGLKLGATNDANASAIHVYDGTTIKAILKMP